jgi:hypothetical protein
MAKQQRVEQSVGSVQPQVTGMVTNTPPSLCKTVGSIAGRCPAPWPSLGDGEWGRVISSPGQAEPYPGTSGAGKGSLRSAPGRPLPAPGEPGVAQGCPTEEMACTVR